VLAAFLSDMERLRALNLPTIAPYIDVFTHDHCLHLVTPYLQGPTLEAYIEEHGPLDPRTFQIWAISLTRTLSAVHWKT
jgi:serine/threonine protein kinase